MAIPKLPPNRPPLYPSAFIALPVGAVRPRGWLLDQLRVQANGLTGHLDEFWPDVGANSAWLGGTGEAWERGPYYCDGLVPLAHLLNDERLLDKANRWMEAVITRARPNGQFGPTQNVDWWARMVMLKALAQQYEATGDSRILELLTNYFRYQSRAIKARPLEFWSKARAMENILVVHWLYNLTRDSFLLDLAETLFNQMIDWPEMQALNAVAEIIPLQEYRGGMYTHVVNNAMAVKAAGVFYPQSGAEWHRVAPRVSIENLLRHHGQPTGIWSGDEHLHGRAPTQGTELCAVAEFMFSLEELLRILGDPFYGDQLELVGYNAFPATFKPDMWAHQYDQQVNQVLCTVAPRHWTDNNDDSNIYGLEPNFGCCTANMHQGWPKLVKSLVMATNDNGLAIVAYGPCEAEAEVAGGMRAQLTVDTQYPFDGRVDLRLALPHPAAFPLLLRIPAWASGMVIEVNGEQLTTPAPNSFARLERTWQDGDHVQIVVPMEVRFTTGHEGLVSVYWGPLLYGLKIGERWQKIAGEEPHADWEVYPTTPWNYGLVLNGTFEVESTSVSAAPFDPAAAPVRLHTPGKRLLEWELVDNNAGSITGGPHVSAEPTETITLIPYGSTNLRIAAFPVVKA